jgi:8-oxo-dGTP pyrophosphatase MutT (NUDIX family)
VIHHDGDSGESPAAMAARLAYRATVAAVSSELACFGTPRSPYRHRPGAYGVTVDGDDVLVIVGRLGLYLPGGGVHRDEELPAALEREFAEETGLTLDSADMFWIADQWVDTDQGAVRKRCHFYRVLVGASNELAAGARWVPGGHAMAEFAEAASSEALRRTLEAFGRPGRWR